MGEESSPIGICCLWLWCWLERKGSQFPSPLSPTVVTAGVGVTTAEKWVGRMLGGEGGAWRPELTRLKGLEQGTALPLPHLGAHQPVFTRGPDNERDLDGKCNGG